MSLNRQLQEKEYDKIWHRYCSFLNLTVADFMEIQKRLLMEQIELYSQCELGKRIMKGKRPASLEEYRRLVPLTRYDDYSDILLTKSESALPAKPVLWIETTWEGGKNPIKVAPYTEQMVECHKDASITIIILASSNKKGQVNLRGGENFLYGMAPLPYLTGMVPHLISREMDVNFLPSIEEAESMRFSERSKVGFDLGMQKGIDLFFGLSSIVVKIGDSFVSGDSSNKKSLKILKNSPKMNYNFAKAWVNSKKYKKPILPKDIWNLKGLICAGTDSASLKDKIEEYWGVKPLEIFAGTEASCVATESWEKKGLVFFPDACLYEFIPKTEFEKNVDNPDYIPKTYLINEVIPGVEYELVISNFKGGVFARYRTGDIFECLTDLKGSGEIKLPHFKFVDREYRFIDIAGFTRISERTINEALKLSKVDIYDWFAVKEFNEENKAFLHMYVETGFNEVGASLSKDVIKEHMIAYFNYIDKDFKNLKTMLNLEPLELSILPVGTIDKFQEINGREFRRMNPSHFDLVDILKLARDENASEVI